MKITFISHMRDDYGPRTLAAILHQMGHSISRIVIEGPYQPLSDTALDRITELCSNSDLIGYSLFTQHFPKARQVTEHLHANLSAPVIWGGVHPSAVPEQCIDYADAVFMGEAETSLAEFVKRYAEEGRVPVGTKGTWVKDESGIHKTPFPDLITDLDALPFPLYDFSNEFILLGEEVVPITAELYAMSVEHYMTYPTRGCPYKCTFCFNNMLDGQYGGAGRFRRRSVDNIIQELKWAKENLPPFKWVQLADDMFMASPKNYIREFSARFKTEIGLNLKVTGATASTITEEKLVFLLDAGMQKIRMGIQTGSESTLKDYKRTDTLEKTLKATHLLHKYSGRMDMPPSYDIIVDNPWETDEDLIDTLMFLAEIPPPYILNIHSLTFYPGTEIYTKALAEGLITADYEYKETFFWCHDTYLNRLIMAIGDQASKGKGIPVWLMKILVNKLLRELQVAPLLYAILYKRSDFAETIRDFAETIRAGYALFARHVFSPFLSLRIPSFSRRVAETIRAGDFHRALRFLKRQYGRLITTP